MQQLFLWWGVLLFAGIAFLPLSYTIFRGFEDKGWLFSKTLSLFLSAWLMWTLNCIGLAGFTQRNSILVICICAVVIYLVYFLVSRRKKGTSQENGTAKDPKGEKTGLLADLLQAKKLILIEEVLFLLLFALGVYIVGFKPEAYGTEKFMDYAFLTSMMRSLKMPFADPWYAGEAINYYYGGQYIAAFLTKITSVTAGEGYNLMRALVTAFSFVLPFSLVFQLMHDRMTGGKNETGKGYASYLAGIFGGMAVAFCGNFHYVVYGIFLPLVNKVKGTYYSYWFPDSTRYIGYNPDLPDKTIHEFPAYSSVLGDLHAHYINLLFVLTVTAIVYGWAKKQDPRRQRRFPFLCLEVILCGFFTGVFRWTNYWDFPIYFVVCGAIFFFVLLRSYREEILKFIFVMLGVALVMFACGYVGSLPFTLSFDTISTKVALTHSHTLFHQLLILWGLPAACLIGFIIRLIYEKKKRDEGAPKVLRKLRRMALPDLAVLLFGLCAAGLVLLPEFIYVVDIYSGSHYRANTMFKLSYQAFILFGICMAYILIRAIVLGGKARKAVGFLGLFLLLLTGGFIIQSVGSWFGNIFDPSLRVHLDASVFVSEYFPTDFEAINYLNGSVGGQPNILEAVGDSYSDCERVSVATGLPTVAGWRVHEWLWRGNVDELDARIADCEQMYTSTDEKLVKELLKKYNVSYIYVGDLERENYPEINETLLKSLGETVFESGETYIIRVDL